MPLFPPSVDFTDKDFDGAAMVTMAHACKGLLSAPPVIALLEGVSAHDLN